MNNTKDSIDILKQSRAHLREVSKTEREIVKSERAERSRRKAEDLREIREWHEEANAAFALRQLVTLFGNKGEERLVRILEKLLELSEDTARNDLEERIESMSLEEFGIEIAELKGNHVRELLADLHSVIDFFSITLPSAVEGAKQFKWEM